MIGYELDPAMFTELFWRSHGGQPRENGTIKARQLPR